MHFRFAMLFASILVALFVQIGMCPNCTFGLCGVCEISAPAPEPVKEIHACCQNSEEQTLPVASTDTKPCDAVNGCVGGCTMKRTIEDRLWSQVKSFHFNGFSSDELLVAEIAELNETVPPAAEHTLLEHPPPRFHSCTSSTVLLL